MKNAGYYYIGSSATYGYFILNN